MHNSSLQDLFLAPILSALQGASSRRQCHVLSDEAWLLSGVRRTLRSVSSGRDFLQWFGGLGAGITTYFESLKSKRRLALVMETASATALSMADSARDALAEVLPMLNDFDVYAGDGHFHEHAVHDKPFPGTDRKFAVGHLFGLNLRTQALTHLTAGDQTTKKKEHDMGALKRIGAALRLDAPTGRKVLWIWDRAGISFSQWRKWKQSLGVYFLSRVKENMILEKTAELPFDKSDPVNEGVNSDSLCWTSQGTAIRVVEFSDPLSGKVFQFITNLQDTKIPPGAIAQLYRMRWDVEKTFDEIKNKLIERKAWASSETAKTIQANLICITMNAVRMFERAVEEKYGITNHVEAGRGAERLDADTRRLEKIGRRPPSLYVMLQRATQTSVKFYRWIRYTVFSPASDAEALASLRSIYARY